MNALVTTHVHLSDTETGGLLVTARRFGTHTAVAIAGGRIVVHGDVTQLHALAGAISNAVDAENPETVTAQ